MAKHLLAPPQGRCIALQSQDTVRPVLSSPLSTSSWGDSCAQSNSQGVINNNSSSGANLTPFLQWSYFLGELF